MKMTQFDSNLNIELPISNVSRMSAANMPFDGSCRIELLSIAVAFKLTSLAADSSSLAKNKRPQRFMKATKEHTAACNVKEDEIFLQQR